MSTITHSISSNLIIVRYVSPSHQGNVSDSVRLIYLPLQEITHSFLVAWSLFLIFQLEMMREFETWNQVIIENPSSAYWQLMCGKNQSPLRGSQHVSKVHFSLMYITSTRAQVRIFSQDMNEIQKKLSTPTKRPSSKLHFSPKFACHRKQKM